MKFYCYVYYDENWQAYYVGKGIGRRMYRPFDHPELPSKERIQRFDFNHEWQAWECEIELIAFWGRQCDGGLLLNKSTGGPGSPGIKHSAKTKEKLSIANKGKKLSVEHKAKISASSKGKKHAAKSKAKMSAAQKGRKESAKTKARKSAAMKEYWRRIKEEQA